MIRASLMFVLAMAVPLSPALAQTPSEIVDRMLEAFERNAAAVENYSVVQEVMGFESELYFEKETVDGRPVFRLRGSSSGGLPSDMDDDVGYTDVYAAAPQLVEHARYGGTEQVHGAEAHVLLIDDLEALDLGAAAAPEDAEFRPRSGRILIDAEMWVPRRMEFAGDLDTGNGVAEVTSVIDMQDYREDEGMLMPYLTVVRMEGMEAAIDPEMRAELEEMRAQLEELPEGQRAMVEEMFGGRMEQMEALLGGEEGAMTVEMRVLELRVNEGPPR
ncbi:MAG: hypothetical protein U5R14_03770 [Gemmatimonadota bacterium]|nr:hypothetical protein [Gemmatimonadota bacterium]